MEQSLKDAPTVSPKGRWLVWSLYLACWTAALVSPIGIQHEWVVTSIDLDLKFLAAKTLHLVGYGLLAGLSGWLRVSQRFRWLLMFVLMSHGTVTELIQQFVPGRSGTLHDVAFDQVGIAVGMLLTRKWWIEPV